MDRVARTASAARSNIGILVSAYLQRKIRADPAAETRRVELESGIAGQRESDAARVRVHLVASVLRDRAAVFDCTANRTCVQALHRRVAQLHLAAHGADIERSRLESIGADAAADARRRQIA